ncbi:uroporphyrinogen-III synthase [Prosthecochloris sp. N3]|uniref:Uroporphyrinogen-III synthase n=1 Tax=Prosthecochloris ethylica TaxID=2743976 RepID=A0ABR9XR18_9CHLB|nr:MULTISPECIES: uroporphyrinogen-III synthase [Prosthecochloris]MBF0585546.1 uroporphyrinogen-III synthase [Prosthecochloris ethylica]MBF0636332.1 uroporphyrinogen-III synthase [Prosthecochloris ethylica]NUK46776.1 uroporphyrinogen-III synthase [Prosthecochloris ethylica]RNA64644.1 uroporphyrinogen-III synthase [Prosthecochloris sp. ZM_2]
MKSVLVTRPKHQAGSFVSELGKYDLNSVVFPTIEIRPAPPWEIPDISSFAGAFFTSPNSVRYFLQRLQEEAPEELAKLKTINVYAVGKTTARDLGTYGISTEPLPKVADAVNLMQTIEPADIDGKSFLFLKGNLSLGVIPKVIAERGGRCHAITVYENHPPDLERAREIKAMIDRGGISCLSFTSPSTAENFFKAMGTTELPSGVLVAAIGKTTAHALEQLGVATDIVPEYYDAPHFAKAIAEALRHQNN